MIGKTVGILTYHNAYNHGAVLQAFALQRTLAGLGNACSIIDYDERRPDGDYRLFRVPLTRSNIRHDLLMLLNVRAHRTSRIRYKRFRAEHLSLTAQSYQSIDDIVRGDLRFDAFVAGSDQIWHPLLLDRSCGPIYFLDFVSSGRRIAYGPSFGLSEVPPQYRERTAGFIKRFDCLSAREDTGCKIIQDLTGRAADHVLDPTLLQNASEYDQVAVSPPFDKPYILLYPMQLSDRLQALAVKMRTLLKMPIIAVVPAFFEPWRFSFADKLVFDAGPAEFLGWMKNASFVCTNSFHGTCFSIIYQKSFLGVPHTGTNTRIHSLLESLELRSRQVIERGALSSESPLLESIDYSSVAPRLQQQVNLSMAYLKRALT
jgi:hypothetical protein